MWRSAPYKQSMRIVSQRALHDYYKRKGRDGSKASINAWIAIVEKDEWSSPVDIKARWSSASIIADNRVVFNIAGNKHRLVVKVNYDAQIVFVRFIGTHAEYDRIDAATV